MRGSSQFLAVPITDGLGKKFRSNFFLDANGTKPHGICFFRHGVNSARAIRPLSSLLVLIASAADQLSVSRSNDGGSKSFRRHCRRHELRSSGSLGATELFDRTKAERL